MRTYLISYVGTAVCLLALDIVWLSITPQRLYRPVLGDLLRRDFKPVPAVIFYLLYVAGIVFFAVAPALDSGIWTTAAVNGALLGLVAFGTYDLSNHATLLKWSTKITVVDLCWGTVLTATCATAGFFAARFWG